MKRLIALLLALVMVFALVACAPKADEPVVEDEPAVEDEPVVEDTPAVEDEPAVEDQPAEDPTMDQPAEDPTIDQPASPDEGPADMPVVDAPETPSVPSGETVGQTLLKDFQDRISANPSASAQELAEGIIANPIIAFMGGAMPMEPGFFSGFDNLEITEFKEASMFAPMMGTIPFVGYVFVLEDGADVEGFKQMLSDNANLRWNICTSAEELVVESSGNTVFFLMCPASMEA